MNRRWSILLGIMGLLALPLTGCTHVRNSVYCFLEDAQDIVRADASVSFGTDMGAHIMLTQWVQLKSYSYEDLYRVGFNARRYGIWKEERNDWWIGPRCAGNWNAKSNDVLGFTAGIFGKARSGQYGLLEMTTESADEVGVGLHLFVIGFRVGFRPFEFLDWLTSPFGLDLAHDNLSWEERRALHAAEKQAREAAAKKAEEEKKKRQDESGQPKMTQPPK